MKKIKSFALPSALLLMSVSGFAFADNVYYPAYPATYAVPVVNNNAFIPPNHFMIGIQAGIGGIQTPSDPTYDYYYPYDYYDSTNNQTYATFSYRAYLGYLFRVAPRFQIGPEVTYFGYGENSYSYTTYKTEYNPYNYPYYVPNGNFNVNYKGYSLEYLLALKYYFAPRIAITGQMGAASVTQTLQTTQSFDNKPSVSESTTSTKILPDFGIGMAFDLSPNFSINMTYNYIIGNNLNTIDIADGSNNNVTSVGAFLMGFDFDF